MTVSDTTDTVDTSTNEEAVETELEDSFDDGVSFEDADDDETEQSDESEQNEQEADTDQLDDEEDSEEDEDGSDDTEDSDESEGEEDKSELSDEEQRKQHNREMAERRIQEKQRNEQEREQALRTSQQEYLNEAGDDEQQRAIRQLQIGQYNNAVESNTNRLTNDYEKAVKDFAILGSKDPVIAAEIDQALDAFQAQFTQLDQLGNPVVVNGNLYQYLQNKADSLEKLRSSGVREQQKSKTKEKSKTLAPPTRSPKEAKVDQQLEGFDEEAGRW